MKIRMSDSNQSNTIFDEDAIRLATLINDKIKSTLDIVQYLMHKTGERPYTVMITSAKYDGLYEKIRASKRDTDILFEVDKERSVYILICQDTPIDRAYIFADRVMSDVAHNGGENIYCSILGIRNTKQELKQIVLKAVEMYVKSQNDKADNQIIYYSLNT